jgi:hypothetical protein
MIVVFMCSPQKSVKTKTLKRNNVKITTILYSSVTIYISLRIYTKFYIIFLKALRIFEE